MNTLAALGLLLLAVLALAAYRLRGSRSRPQADSPIVARVKRRRELQAALLNLVGCDLEAARLVQAEAQRLQVPRGSHEALEAAIKRAEVEQALDRR
jgi:hypothetical protein